MKRLIILLLILFPYSPVFAATIVDTDFEDGWGSLSPGSYWSLDPTGGKNGSQCAYLNPTSGIDGYNAIPINVSSYNSQAFWVEFDVRANGDLMGGSKYIKYFGYNSPTGNNITVGIAPWTGAQSEVAYCYDTLVRNIYGGGNAGTNCAAPTRIVDTGSIQIKGNVWRHYKLYLRRADSGVQNGEMKIWVDGVLKEHFTNMDSNPSNYATAEARSKIGSISLWGYINSKYITSYDGWGDAWIDNLYIGTTEKDASSEPVLSNSLPSSTLAYGTTQTTLGITSDTSSTCRYSLTADVPYTSMANTFSNTGGTTHTQTISGLTNGQNVPYYVKCNNGTESNSSDYIIYVAVAAVGCDTDADECGTESECTTNWPAYNWCADETPSCTSSTCDECSYNLYYLCSDQPSCESAGRYWWADACRTIANPGDITGSNKITSGDFTVSSSIDDWTLYNSSNVAITTNGVELSDSGTIAQDASMDVETQYRFVADIISLTGTFIEWNYNDADQEFTSTGTVTGLTTREDGGDTRIFFKADTSSVVTVNNIALYEVSTGNGLLSQGGSGALSQSGSGTLSQ